jgi:8-oxo-dGTP pyrophosphatase MutT (NUDIX family)
LKPTLFIASSSEKEEIARAIELNVSEHAEVTIWPHAFTAGKSFYDELVSKANSFDFAVIVITPDDQLTVRDETSIATRDNVIFELGLFLGTLGPERVFAVNEAGTGGRIMSDYKGVRYLTYDGNRSDRNLQRALSPAATEVISSIRTLNRRNKIDDVKNFLFPGELIGLEKIFDNFDVARPYIFEDLRSTEGPIRIFIHIASQDIGLKGSFFDVLDGVANKGTVDIRVLHADAGSPLFAKSRMVSLGKDYDRVLDSLNYAASSLRSLEQSKTSSLRRRSHSLPFIWRLYFVFDRLYFMPYFTEKDAVKNSPVLVFRRTSNSLYHVFKDWFDYAWEFSMPERVRLDDIISSAAPAGSALFLTWHSCQVFGIPRRDLTAHGGRVRFYGIGGKRESAEESFETCALREGNEELGGAIEGLEDASLTTYVRNDGTLRNISISGEKIKPRLILEKANHSGLGAMPVNADDYFLVGYEGVLRDPPKPSRELAAVILLPEDALRLFVGATVVTVADVLALGSELICQPGVNISDEVVLTPHGLASFVVRSLA